MSAPDYLPQSIIDVCQRIRAGWLPYREAGSGSWWWGRPANLEGFFLWSQGDVPAMAVAELMEPDEVEAWQSTLHWAAPEATT